MIRDERLLQIQRQSLRALYKMYINARNRGLYKDMTGIHIAICDCKRRIAELERKVK